MVEHDDDNNEHTIAYASRKLLPREHNFSTIEKETLAVVWALKTFERYMYGVHTTVETDHNCLRWLNTISVQNPIGLLDGLFLCKSMTLQRLSTKMV